MTVPDEQTSTTPVTEDVASPERIDLPPQRTEQAEPRTLEPTTEVGASTVAQEAAPSRHQAVEQTDVPAPRTEESAGRSQESAEKELFGENDLSGFRSRWDDVQSGFVDDPKECVHKADGLVSEVVEQLTTGFSEARSRLEAQWARGEEASTEDLRLALKRYREFFQRLLSV
jgi:hypothetical protein